MSAALVCVLNPSRVRAFARSEGIKAKTDAIDTAVLLRFAQQKALRPTPAPDPTHQELAALMDRRGHLSSEIAREKNRLDKAPHTVMASIKRMIRLIDKEIAAIERKIEKLIEHDPKLNPKARIITGVHGVGKVTSWSILAYLGEITELSRNQLVALAGVAPYNRDSGKTIGKRSIYGGRAKVRKCLYMAAKSAAQHNPVIKAYVEGLRARGKPYKCALVAAMRKLLIHIQSLLRKYQFTLAS